MANNKSTFLIEEYRQLHESLYKNNEVIVTGIRFMITLFAACAGAILVAFVKEDQMERKTVLIAVAGVSCFFFITCFMGSFFLLQTFKGARRMFSAINAIRSYYVSIENIPKEFVIMPLSKTHHPHRVFGGWPAIYLAHAFTAIFFLLGSITTLHLSLQPVPGLVRILTCVSLTIILLCWHGVLIERAISKATTTERAEGNSEITSEVQSEGKTGKSSNAERE